MFLSEPGFFGFNSELEIDRIIRLKETTIKSLNEINTEDAYGILYSKCLKNEPVLSRIKTIPARFKDSLPAKDSLLKKPERNTKVYIFISSI